MPTLKELLEKGESFKYGTDYRTVEAEKQSLSNFEDNGLRVNFGQRFGDLPNFGNLTERLYGTETLRITKQSTALVDDMKQSASVNQGLLGGITNFVNKVGNQFASALGIPVLQIPTRVSQDNQLKIAIKGDGPEANNVMVALAKIRKKQEGNIIGKFLKQTAKGTPNQLGRRAVGTARNIAKNAAKNLLFGDGSGGVNQVANQTLSIREDDVIKYGSRRANQYSSQLGRRSVDGELGIYALLNDIQNDDPSVTTFIIDKEIEDANNRPNLKNKEIFPFDFPQFSVDSITQNIPGRRESTNKYTDVNGLFKTDKLIINETSDGTKGKFRTKSDDVNLKGVQDGFSQEMDDSDFIPLRFYSIAKDKTVAFKATLSGITETFAPSWESANFIGNPYSFYTYQSINRKLDFSFLIYSLSSEEHKKNWEKIDFFSSLVYPQNTQNTNYITPPLLRMTMGNMYKSKVGFIESLSYTIDDTTPWEIGLGATKTGNRITNLDPSSDLKDYKLPTIINVTISYQFVETSSDIVGKKLYRYGTTLGNVEVGQGDFGSSIT
jgi:hypothetical protein